MSKWEWKKLKDVCVFIGDGDWIESKDQSSKGIRLIQTGNIGNGIYLDKKERSHYISETTFCRLHCTEIFSGDCLISRLPEPIGRACVIPDIAEKMITAVDCTIVRFCEFFAPNFFIYYAQSEKYFSDVKSESTGATRKRISRKNLENIKIPVPPLSEQKRIVKFLDEEFSKIDTLKTNAETNLKNARELFETTLEKELNPLSRHSERSEESCADLPSGWEWKTLDEFSTNLDAKRKPVTKKNRVNGNYPYYGASGIVDYVDSYIYDGKYLLISEDGANLVARSTPIAFIAEGKFWVNNHAHIIETMNEATLQYLVYFFENLDLSPYVKGMAQPKLSQDSLYKIQIPLPPLSVQKEIVARLDKLSENVKRLEANYKKIIANCDELKKSILKKTFEEKT